MADVERSSRNSYHTQHGASNNGDTAVQPDQQSCSLTVYPNYFRTVLGVLRICELIVGIIVISTANAEQCVTGVLCGSPSGPMWYGELGGQGYVLFVGIVFIFGNIALILYHLFTRPSSVSSSTADNLLTGELVYNGVAVLLYIIAASVEAWYASWSTLTIKIGPEAGGQQSVVSNVYRPQWIASTIFAWINVLLYAAHLVYMYFFDDTESR